MQAGNNSPRPAMAAPLAIAIVMSLWGGIAPIVAQAPLCDDAVAGTFFLRSAVSVPQNECNVDVLEFFVNQMKTEAAAKCQNQGEVRGLTRYICSQTDACRADNKVCVGDLVSAQPSASWDDRSDRCILELEYDCDCFCRERAALKVPLLSPRGMILGAIAVAAALAWARRRRAA